MWKIIVEERHYWKETVLHKLEGGSRVALYFQNDRERTSGIPVFWKSEVNTGKSFESKLFQSSRI